MWQCVSLFNLLLTNKCMSVKTVVCRQKRSALPAEPVSLQDLIVDGSWSMTGGPHPQQFLQYDSGQASAERVLLFVSPEQLRHLATATRWFMDGNFAMAPPLFQQLYIITAPVGESAVTCVYALLTGVLLV